MKISCPERGEKKARSQQMMLKAQNVDADAKIMSVFSNKASKVDETAIKLELTV